MGWGILRGMKIGYARVSTDEQNLDLQRQALEAEGCACILEDKASGALPTRKGLTAALAQCNHGDILVVWKLDRLGRSLLHLVGLVENLKARGIGLKVLTGQGAQVDTSRPEGRMIFGIMATLAEFERELIRERTRAGMAAAIRRGVRVGRPKKLTGIQLDRAAVLIDGGMGCGETAFLFGVNVATLRRALRREGLIGDLRKRTGRLASSSPSPSPSYGDDGDGEGDEGAGACGAGAAPPCCSRRCR